MAGHCANYLTAALLLILVGLVGYVGYDASHHDSSKPTPITRQPTQSPTAAPTRTFNGDLEINASVPFSDFANVGRVEGNVVVDGNAASLGDVMPQLEHINGTLDLTLTGDIRFGALTTVASVTASSGEQALLQLPALTTVDSLTLSGGVSGSFDAIVETNAIAFEASIALPNLVRIQTIASGIVGNGTFTALRCCGEGTTLTGCLERPPCVVTGDLTVVTTADLRLFEAVDTARNVDITVAEPETATMHLTVCDDLKFQETSLTSIALPHLTEVNNLWFEDNNQLQTISVPALQSAVYLRFFDCPSLNTTAFDSLGALNELILKPESESNNKAPMDDMQFPLLANVNSRTQVAPDDIKLLTALNFPNWNCTNTVFYGVVIKQAPFCTS